MGMTDKQFAGFLRQMIRTLKRALASDNVEDMKEIVSGLLEDLQQTLED
jgi:hypothetical protein|nr:hypothetical protein [uncultured Oscillibacter sp.]